MTPKPKNAKELKRLRISNFISQVDIAEEMRTNRSYISHVETGLRPLTDEFRERYIKAVETLKTKMK